MYTVLLWQGGVSSVLAKTTTKRDAIGEMLGKANAMHQEGWNLSGNRANGYILTRDSAPTIVLEMIQHAD